MSKVNTKIASSKKKNSSKKIDRGCPTGELCISYNISVDVCHIENHSLSILVVLIV